MSVQLTGFDELVQALTDAPDHIRDQGMVIVREETEGAKTEIETEYGQHSKTGKLAKRVKTSYPAESVLIGIVSSTAPHSHLYEWGTRKRRTANGANRGAMPEHKVTPRIAQKRRERMFRRLKEMLVRLGFTLSQ